MKRLTWAVIFLFYFSTLPLWAAPNARYNRVTVDNVIVFNDNTSQATAYINIDNVYKLSSPYVDVRAHASVNAAVTAIGATDNTLLIPTAQTLTASLTIPANVTVSFIGAGKIVKASTYTLAVNGKIVAPPAQQIFSGFAAGDVTISPATNPTVYPDWWQGNTTPGITDMTTALASAVRSVIKYIKLLGTKYAFTGLTIPDNTMDLTIEGAAVEYSFFGPGSTQLWYTPTTGNAITFAGDADYFTIKNLTINAHDSESTGTAIQDADDPTKVLRSFVADRLHIYGFKKGIRIGDGVRAFINQGYFSGQLKTVSGGVGVEFGYDDAKSLNLGVIRDTWVINYETNVWNHYCTDLTFDSSLASQGAIGLKADAGRTNIRTAYMEGNDNTISKGASAYVYGDWSVTAGGGGNILVGKERFVRTGTNNRAVAYRNGAISYIGNDNLIVFNAAYHTGDDNFNVSTGKYTNNLTEGFYLVQANVRMTAANDNQSFRLDLFMDNAVIPNTGAVFNSRGYPSLDNTFGGMVSRVIWLEMGAVVDVRVSVSEAMALHSARFDIAGP